MRRQLLQAEVDFLSRYFGNTLDTDSIRLAATRGRRAYSIRSAHIRLPRHCFVNLETAAPVNLLNPLTAATLVHEATHVWQRQSGLWVTLRGALLQLGDQCGIDPYAYDRAESNPMKMLSQFLRGNIEQQGQIVQDLVFSELTGQQTLQFGEVRAYLLGSQSSR